MDHLDQLENRSVHILREAYANFKHLGMLWSIGKDSTVLLWLARKAFFGHVPFPLITLISSSKFPGRSPTPINLSRTCSPISSYGKKKRPLPWAPPSRTAPAIP